MTIRSPVGFLCQCGSMIPISGVELDEGETLDDKKHRLMLEGWQKIVVHQGCSKVRIGRVLNASDLLLVPQDPR